MRDVRIRDGWPCHGPVPWPAEVPGYREAMKAWMDELERIGTAVVELIALGLGLEQTAISSLCEDGWHQMQAIHYPQQIPNRKGFISHTDTGLLVLVAQDSVGGLSVRPPIEGEPRLRNW